jgi:hypothetical protein
MVAIALADVQIEELAAVVTASEKIAGEAVLTADAWA